MTKTIYILLAFLLIATPAFANPKGSSDFSTGQFIILGVLTLGIGLLIYNLFSPPPKATFQSEEIGITLLPNGFVEVDGKYKFTRPDDSVKHFKITYPFPKSKDFGNVQIKKMMVNGAEIENVSQHLNNPKQVTLELFFEGKDELEFEIVFLQKPPRNSYKYILETTKSWKKPLESCKINLHLPEGFAVAHCNYNLISLENEEGRGKEYQLTAFNFYPEEDLKFSWK
ncbi:MAG: hypothetical protein K9N09_11410 [Candidatus Cloacimonetes bacterium]|nr:hypothetical protein [Candidatus Cloacimonadota bacterium]MCF7813550.1 hypothetical protein [Candidatus Cloacimonadota bacterium]MCF7869291.1 hypothetical protein [Candidatus Cloacimonadota bacterium]MCF7884204.1 hypothetical protein [Candidatus Cloacimonadota bacterium]